uniref:CAND6/7 N-terminal domain-containing protein n=1 Tax=Leersia perrieri TaxID=77586 RepID=A0A0D9W9S0_9ORYZ
MAAATAQHLLPLMLIVTGDILHQAPVAAHVKHNNYFFQDDPRQLILVDNYNFGSSRQGSLSIAVNVKSRTEPNPDPSLAGFFILLDGTPLNHVIHKMRMQGRRTPKSSYVGMGCILNSPYVMPLFTFAHLDGDGRYGNTFPVTRPGEHGVYFANCARGTRVTVDVHVDAVTRGSEHSESSYLSVTAVTRSPWRSPTRLSREEWWWPVGWRWIKYASVLVQLACCVAVLLMPMDRVIRALRKEVDVDDMSTAARRLARLVVFRQLNAAVAVYIYSTRMAVIILEFLVGTNSGRCWATVVAEEAATVVFYTFMFCKFGTVGDNPVEDAQELIAGGI